MAAMPYDLKTAQKLKEKGYLSDDHFAKLEKLHGEFSKAAQKMDDGGEVEPEGNFDSTPDTAFEPSAPTDYAAAVRQMPPSQERGPGEFTSADIQNTKNAEELSSGAQPVQQGSLPDIITPVSAPGVEPPPAAPANITLASDQGERQPQVTPANEFLSKNPYGLGYDMQQQGVATELNAARSKGAAEAAQYKAAADKVQDIQNQRQAYADDQDKYLRGKLGDLDKQIDDYSKQKVDPNRFWNSRTTGDKVLAGIGLFLGSFGGDGNQAVKVIQNSIDRDVQAQAVDIATQGKSLQQKQGLYADMLNLYKNKDAAYAAAQAAGLSMAQLKVQEMAARYGGQEAQGKAQQLYGQLEIQKQQASMQLQQQLMKMYAMQNPQGNMEWLDKDQRERLVPGFKGFTTNPDTAKELIKAKGSADSASGVVDQLLNIANMGPQAKLDPDVRARADVLSHAALGLIKDEFVGPRLTDADKPILEAMATNPLEIFSLNSAQQARLKTLRGLLQEGLTAKAKAAGLTPYNDAMALQSKTEMPKAMGPMPASFKK